MFTVLIAEKEHIDAIKQGNKLFFEPFLENKEIAFCYWNPAGQSLVDAVPGLRDAVGRRKDWRAVVINNCSEEFLKSQNPFDVVDYSKVYSLTVPKTTIAENDPVDEWQNSWENYYAALKEAKESVYKEALNNPLSKLATWLCFKPESYILSEVQEKQDVDDWALDQINKDDIKMGRILEALELAQYKAEQLAK